METGSSRATSPHTLAEVAPALRPPLVHDLGDLPASRASLVRRLLKISERQWNRMPPDVQRELAMVTCDFGFGDSPAPLLGHFEHGGITYHMPRADGANVRTLEYASAEGLLRELIAEPTERTLLLLVATYAREAEPDGEVALQRNDVRVALRSRDETEARADRLAGLRPGYAAVVATYAAGLQKLVHELYGAYLFEAEEDGEPRGPRFGPAPLQLGWWGTFMRVAKSGTFGPLPAVHDAYLHDVCAYLAQEVSDAREAERRAKRSGRSAD